MFCTSGLKTFSSNSVWYGEYEQEWFNQYANYSSPILALRLSHANTRRWNCANCSNKTSQPLCEEEEEGKCCWSKAKFNWNSHLIIRLGGSEQLSEDTPLRVMNLHPGPVHQSSVMYESYLGYVKTAWWNTQSIRLFFPCFAQMESLLAHTLQASAF